MSRNFAPSRVSEKRTPGYQAENNRNFAVEWNNGLVFWSNDMTISLEMFFNSKVITLLSIQSHNLSDKCHMKQVSEERVKSTIRILLQPTCIYLYTYLTFVNK